MNRLYALSYLRELKVHEKVASEKEAIIIVINGHRRLRAENVRRTKEWQTMHPVRRWVARIFKLGPQ